MKGFTPVTLVAVGDELTMGAVTAVVQTDTHVTFTLRSASGELRSQSERILNYAGDGETQVFVLAASTVVPHEVVGKCPVCDDDLIVSAAHPDATPTHWSEMTCPTQDPDS